jgi:hypothetical protein
MRVEKIVPHWSFSVAQLRIHQECAQALDRHATTEGLANGLSIFCELISGGICFAIFDHGSREAAVDSSVFFLANETERGSSLFLFCSFVGAGSSSRKEVEMADCCFRILHWAFLIENLL